MEAIRKWWRLFLLVVMRRHPAPLASPPPPPVDIPAPTPTPEQPPPVDIPAPESPAKPDIVPALAMDISPPPEPRMNRHNRRVFERARRRHDNFVEPKGPQPIKHERAPIPPKPDPKPESKDTADDRLTEIDPDPLIVDEWLEGDGEKVLYEGSEFWGQFNFRDTILEQLDRYWIYLERMRKHDPDAYGFYKQIGAILVPYATTLSFSDKPHELVKVKDLEAYKRQIQLSPWFRQTWPAFGCCAFGTNPRDEARERVKLPSGGTIGCPKFMYFRRVERMPWTVQPVRGGKLYVLTVWWDRVDKVDGIQYKWGRPNEFPIQISDDGLKIRALKTRVRKTHEIGSWWEWHIPHHYQEWSIQYGIDAQTHLSHLFCTAVADIERASSSILRVEVSKGDLTAVFGLDPRRTSYFFQDRDIVLNNKGSKRRIFHMVRPYIDKNGNAHPIQFRGLREFTWADYYVRITVPGRDHFMPLEYNEPMHYREGKKLTDDDLREPELATELKRMMRTGLH